jgi:hypothetical protein
MRRGVVVEYTRMGSWRALRSGLRFSAWGVVPLIFSGCVARHVTLSEKGLTCAEAHRVAIETVRRMGYTISDTTKATPGTPGVIVGSRTDGISTRGLMVSVACTTLGAEVEAKSDQTGLNDLNFASEFRRTFESAAANRPPPRPPADSGVDVLLTPERASSFADVGVDLSTAGVLPVSVRITNRTQRTYRFRVTGVRLQTAAGERVAPLGNEGLTSQVGAAAAAALRQKALHDSDIASNATLTGFLYFPFNSYARARVELIDKASDEAEGFAIEF